MNNMTKGPWKVEERIGMKGSFEINSETDSRVMQEWRETHPTNNYFSGVNICRLAVMGNGSGEKFGPSDIIGLDEVRANAQAIAALPELVEFVAKWNRLIGETNETGYSSAFCVDARELLRKAGVLG